MTIRAIKEELNQHVGDKVIIKYNLGRNRYEKYHARIKETYNYVFIVELDNANNPEVKSFSYSDSVKTTWFYQCYVIKLSCIEILEGEI